MSVPPGAAPRLDPQSVPMTEPFVLGVNAAYHESAAVLMRGSEVVLAVEEERYTRTKHAKPSRIDNPDQLPLRAIAACLEAGEVRLRDVDAVGYSLMPGRRQQTIGADPYRVLPRNFGSRAGEIEFDRRVRLVPSLLALEAGDPTFESRVRFLPHHRAHAASAFYASQFQDAAVLVIDGIGEDATAWLGVGSDDGLELLEEVPYPHSLGLVWERVAIYLGFGEYDAGKVMGLAAHGDASRWLPKFDPLLCVPDPEGKGLFPFLVDPAVARFRGGDVKGLEKLFGPRCPKGGDSLEPRFADLAAALQQRTEEALLATARKLARISGKKHLAYAGGVALNCVANTRLEREGPFEAIYVQGAANDAGTALGAAYLLAHELGVELPRRPNPLPPLLGPRFDADAIDAAIAEAGLQAERLEDPAAHVAKLLDEGAVVGWFQGRLEFGPRALGNRSLLVDPRRAEARERLNKSVKHRELFRPFAASILSSEAGDWLELPDRQPGARESRDLMILAYPVRPEQRERIPAVVHEDGTCRIQLVDSRDTPEYHALISAFFVLTGVPLLLNTSFNDQEPIVATPAQALATFKRTGIDAVVLGDRLVRRAP